MGISFGSINTGLPKDIVKQIMTAERVPIKKMESRKENISQKQVLVNELNDLVNQVGGYLAKNGNARSLREFKAIFNNEIIEVNIDKNRAEPGSYQFEVPRLAQKSSAMTSGFEDPDNSYVGVGFIQYTLPNGDTKDIYVDEENSSLNDIAKIINKDKSNGMRATVVNDGFGGDAPWRIIISLEDTGDEMMAEFPYFYFVDGEQDLYLDFEREAHDALVKLDGFEIELMENKASDLIPGVNIDLKKAAPGEEFTIQIVEDTEKITDKLSLLIENVNKILQFIVTQNTLDENTDTSKTLGGDITLQTIESRIRGTIFKPIETSFGMKRIGDLGVMFNRSGLLDFDSSTFQSKLKENYNMVSEILTGYFPDEETLRKTDGFMDNLNTIVKGILRNPDGIITSRKRGIRSKIDDIDRQIARKEKMLEKREQMLKDKFSRLEGTISRIRAQGAGLQALQQGAAFNPVQQLG